jgi:excisionase family DNA binding protein
MNFPMGLNLTAECGPALEAARKLPQDRLPQFLGDLEECRAVAQTRLLAPAPVAAPDEYLTVKEAAKLLSCSPDTLYKRTFPFVRRLGRKRLFSRNGIEEYLKKQGR